MQNIVVNVCENFHGDRSTKDRALGDRNSDNNTRTGTLVALGDPFPGLKIDMEHIGLLLGCSKGTATLHRANIFVHASSTLAANPRLIITQALERIILGFSVIPAD